ncbi:MAG: hypothetical protein IKS72_03920, partial [Prevotella sp.]|nr:hypothetical protein [Prevotella sp.]
INSGKLWGDLAECIKWQREQADVLPDIHWVGGHPWDGSKANVYGWASWNGKKATLALRNPSTSQQTFKTTLREALDIPDYITGSITLEKAFSQANLNGLTVGQPIDIDTELTLKLSASSVYVFNGIDSSKTDIVELETDIVAKPSNDCWYNLQGQAMGGEPMQKGIFIRNGKKTIVR